MKVEIDVREVVDAYEDLKRRIKVFNMLFTQLDPGRKEVLDAFEKLWTVYFDDVIEKCPRGKKIIINGDPWPALIRQVPPPIWVKACDPKAN